MVELREHERQTLATLHCNDDKATVEQLTEKTGLPDAAIMRSALTLKEKGLLQIHENKRMTASLNEEGKIHANKGLPERRLATALSKLGGKASTKTTFREANLEEQFAQIALGWAQRKKWTTFNSKSNLLMLIGQSREENDEKLLTLLKNEDKIPVDELSSEMLNALQILKNRKLILINAKTTRTLELTDKGRKATEKLSEEQPDVTQLTQELIVTGKWQNVKLQKYDIQAPVSKAWPGKKHPYNRFLEEVRDKLVALGFKEMTGTFVETSFFHFDALYTPQGHPAREPASIYYVKSPVQGDLTSYQEALGKVKKTHENGWKTGSTGWYTKFSTKEAKRLILRGHGTCLSARALLSKDLEIPGKYFSIARCYRPEIPDKTHLSEFNQVEGIVIDEDLTLRDLLGVLEKFGYEMAGADRVKFKPDYFPFTEPSVELAAYKEGYGWIEFGGSGIFRPEVTLPLGVKEPVIAWGLGVDRLFMMRAGIEEIRTIFTSDLEWLRKKEVI